jgi:hypothetical protein
LGAIVGRTGAQQPYTMMGTYGPGFSGMNSTMMNGNPSGAYGMMGNGMMNGGMMGASGMMGSGMMNGGMMGSLSGLADVAPLSIDEARLAVSDYLDGLNTGGLMIGEIMIFDNHAYVQVLDGETGTGAFEVLVDPITRSVSPEPGPNMMWNTEYGMMGGRYQGMMGMGGRGSQFGNMMGRFEGRTSADPTVSGDEAVQIAQAYLDTSVPGTTAGSQADAFPGYFTLHVERDGNVVGMLSVNAYDGQVFLHHWHGDFVEMNGEEHS